MKSSLNYKPIFIIGAPRSGTNILRNILSLHESINTWNCDEINEVWNYQNKLNHEELDVNKVGKNYYGFILSFFDKFYSKTNTPYILEKTCANSLRVKLIHNIFPNAIFISIYRDGNDVIPSAMKRWNAKFDFNYSFKKFKTLPLEILPNVLFKNVKKWFSLKRGMKMKIWGPKYFNINDHVRKDKEISYICFQQWKRCVEKSIDDFKVISKNNLVIKVRYENLVINPIETVEKILFKLELDLNKSQRDYLKENIYKTSIGKNFKLYQSSIEETNIKISEFVNDSQLLK